MTAIAVYGSAVEPGHVLKQIARRTGQLIAEAGHEVLTGACPGVSHQVAIGAYEAGGTVIGYSPAINLEEHTVLNQDPADVYSKILFVPDTYEYRANLQACYKYRNIKSAMACNAAIIINGRMGTLNEFTLAYDFGKTIAVLEGTGGVADAIRDLLTSLKPSYPDTPIIFSRDPVELIDELTQRLK
ncbi:MAG: hypothetical protein EHM85_11880 [Desulfobacteraceae bacterium]|nr:MAG: hypothetical protein EHM85_11880 [Desulfobacteraceae bacterium]